MFPNMTNFIIINQFLKLIINFHDSGFQYFILWYLFYKIFHIRWLVISRVRRYVSLYKQRGFEQEFYLQLLDQI